MESSSEAIPALIIGTLGHGAAHAAMSIKFRDGSYQQETRDPANKEGLELWQSLLFCLLFWLPLLSATMPKMKKQHVLCLSAFAMYFMRGLPKEISFGYIQTVLSIAFHIGQLLFSSAAEKGRREYMTMPMTAILPIVVAWVEMTLCTSFFRSIGGHVWYDFSIIFSYVIFYYDCYRHHVHKLDSEGRTTNPATEALLFETKNKKSQ